jgi:hypothetical protein
MNTHSIYIEREILTLVTKTYQRSSGIFLAEACFRCSLSVWISAIERKERKKENQFLMLLVESKRAVTLKEFFS